MEIIARMTRAIPFGVVLFMLWVVLSGTLDPSETGSPNFVTAILADYRGYDTLSETTVIFTAGLACVLILWVHIRHPGGGEGA